MIITRKRTLHILIAAASILIFASGYTYLFGKNAEDSKSAKQPPIVTIVTSEIRDLPIRFSAQGHLIALNQIEIRPQITGIIRSVDFNEGDSIKAGQLLFTLDATDANAQFKHAQAQSVQMQAQLKDAEREYERSKELFKKNFIAIGALETLASKVDTLAAQLKSAEADIDSARVTLDHTRITSPIAAQAGAVSVHPGSLAQQAATSLVTLAVFDPIGVEFSLPEQNLTQLLYARAIAPVKVLLDTGGGKTIEGKLIFINNTVSTDTGTINLKASFPNSAKTLWPGVFARVTVIAGSEKAAIVLPPQAILEGGQGRFVYLLGPDNKVTARPINLLRIQDRMAVVSGLASGEKVVLEGNQNLRDGTLVTVSDKPAIVSSSTGDERKSVQ